LLERRNRNKNLYHCTEFFQFPGLIMFRKFFSLLLFPLLAASCSQSSQITKVETKNYQFSSEGYHDIDSTLYKEILPYKESMSADMNTVLIISEEAMERGTPESKLGNFFSDALMEMAKSKYMVEDGHPVDFAFFNNGGLRSSLPRGNITKENVFELMPFENELVVLSLNGAATQKLVNYIASKDGVPVSNLRMGIKGGKPVNVTINGQPFDSTIVYKALTSDYLANGGDQMFFLTDSKKENLNLKIRDALIQYMQVKSRNGATLTTQLDNRINHVQ
jgi:2',3'-cyclic-nucleotide 2'-phosphodiesterase (5'-nucleotidase family)